MGNQTEQEITTWPEFAVTLFDHLTGRAAEITYEFEDLEIFVPSKMSTDANQAPWKLNGIISIRTDDHVQGEHADRNGNGTRRRG